MSVSSQADLNLDSMHPDLNQKFVPDVMPYEARSNKDLPGIAYTLPIFEISPSERHDWVYVQGIFRKSEDSIEYRCDGAVPPPKLRVLKWENPIQIEVSLPNGVNNTKFRYERMTDGWSRLSSSHTGHLH